jgi:chemotaxis protein MotB
MHGMPRRLLLAPLLLSLACGVSHDKYDAALSDANKEKNHSHDLEAQVDAQKKTIADLEKRVHDLEGKTTDEETKAQLEELRKQKAAADARAKLFDEFVHKFKKMTDAGKLDIAVRHGQIVLLLESDVLFDSGKTEVKAEGVAALDDLASALKTVQGRRFVVEGHTDNLPIQTKEFPSNWELSTARGVAVTKLLVKKGVNATTLTAAGHAEFDPVAANASTQARAKNRRIEITLQPNIEELVSLPDLKPVPKEPKEPKEPKPPQPTPTATSKPVKPPPPKAGKPGK